MELGLNKMPLARLRLDLALAPAGPLDYQSVVRLGRQHAGEDTTYFSGAVVRADPQGSQVEMECVGIPAMQEAVIGALVTTRLPIEEHFHVLSRSAGLPETQVNIAGLDRMPLEVFEVVVPVRGVTVRDPTRVGRVTLVPSETGTTVLGTTAVSDELAEEFSAADCHALTLVTARRTLDAEDAALADIDAALGWLVARARYGLAWLPDGQPQRYHRESRRSRPVRLDLVAVRGLRTGRQWLRSVGPRTQEAVLDLADDPLLTTPRLTAELTVQERQALLAVERASTSNDAVAAATAFSEALEFYVGGVEFPDVYTRDQRKRLCAAVPDDLPPDVQRRAKRALTHLNQRPLLERLRLVTNRDGVPLSEGEWHLIKDIRQTRNAGVHGSGAAIPAPERLELAVSLLARFLVFRIANRHR